MQELLFKNVTIYSNFISSQIIASPKGCTRWFFAGPKLKFRPQNTGFAPKFFYRTFGLPLENYLPDRTNHYRKCPTVRRPLGNTDICVVPVAYLP